MTALASVRERNRADRTRRSFSVLCWRGWCDYDFKIRDIADMVQVMTGGTQRPLPTHLPRKECPMPDTCQCVCHDAG
jgi:hypothetical protein